jgi:hypothetical protein
MRTLSGIVAAIILISLTAPAEPRCTDHTSPDATIPVSAISRSAQTTPVLNSENLNPGLFAASSTALPAIPRSPLTGKEKFRLYLHHIAGPQAFASTISAAGIGQARDSEPEWGQGMEGFGKRLGSRFAARVIKNSIHDGLGGLLHEDSRYVYADRPGIWRRALYAAGQTFVAHKDFGGTRFAYSRLIGILGATCLSRQWHPEADRTLGRYVSAGAIWLGLETAQTVFAEFWPDIKKKLLH